MDFNIEQSEDKFFTIVEEKECLLNFRMINNNQIDYYHTFVPPSLRGKGIAQKLIKYALDFAVEKGYKIIPSCWAVSMYVKRHPEYQDHIY